MPNVHCEDCNNVVKKYEKIATVPNCFIIHADRAVIKGKNRKKKKEILQSIEKIVAALRNTCGGVLLIHLKGQEKGDTDVSYFHEFVDKCLENLIEDGKLYTHTYVFRWLSELAGLENNEDVVLLNVKHTHGIATVDFCTKVSNDFEKIQPTTLSIVSMLSEQTNFGDEITNANTCRLQDLRESRHIELKTFWEDKCENNEIDGIANYIWTDLKLKDNLTSMSKQPAGGYYYVGITEENTKDNCYEKIVASVTGFPIAGGKDALKEAIKKKVLSDCSVLHMNGKFEDAPKDLIKITFHEIPHTDTPKYVLEVRVRYFEGVVFYDKDGPRTYKIEGGVIKRMKREEWYHRIYHRLPPWNVVGFHVSQT